VVDGKFETPLMSKSSGAFVLDAEDWATALAGSRQARRPTINATCANVRRCVNSSWPSFCNRRQR